MGFISWVSPQTSALLGKILTRSNLETHSISLLQMQNLCLCDIHMNFETFLSEYWWDWVIESQKAGNLYFKKSSSALYRKTAAIDFFW